CGARELRHQSDEKGRPALNDRALTRGALFLRRGQRLYRIGCAGIADPRWFLATFYRDAGTCWNSAAAETPALPENREAAGNFRRRPAHRNLPGGRFPRSVLRRIRASIGR